MSPEQFEAWDHVGRRAHMLGLNITVTAHVIRFYKRSNPVLLTRIVGTKPAASVATAHSILSRIERQRMVTR